MLQAELRQILSPATAPSHTKDRISNMHRSSVSQTFRNNDGWHRTPRFPLNRRKHLEPLRSLRTLHLKLCHTVSRTLARTVQPKCPNLSDPRPGERSFSIPRQEKQKCPKSMQDLIAHVSNSEFDAIGHTYVQAFRHDRHCWKDPDRTSWVPCGRLQMLGAV